MKVLTSSYENNTQLSIFMVYKWNVIFFFWIKYISFPKCFWVWFFFFFLGDVSLSPVKWEYPALLEIITVRFTCWHLSSSHRCLLWVTQRWALCPSCCVLPLLRLPSTSRSCSTGQPAGRSFPPGNPTEGNLTPRRSALLLTANCPPVPAALGNFK